MTDEVKVGVGGVPILATERTAFVSWLCSRTAGSTSVRLVNAYSIALSAKDEAFAEILAGPGLNVPDGLPVALLARMGARHFGRPCDRIRGPSLFQTVLDEGRVVSLRHYFLGGSEMTLDLLVSAARRRFPGVEVCGSFSPPFGPVGIADIDSWSEGVLRAQPDIVWVGLGTPKQDFATARLAEVCGLPTIGVGAAFDFLAGTVREAPEWVQRVGLEWLFRLSAEPARLWRRYLIGNLQFLAVLVREFRIQRMHLVARTRDGHW